jgi:hypothetical protein
MNSKRLIVLSIVGVLAMMGLLLVVTGTQARGDERGSTAALAQASVVSGTISYQGRLLNADGTPVEGMHTMAFRLYAQASGGVPLWTDSFPVPVEKGLFHVTLGVDPALFDGRALWLGVWVEGDTEEVTPRQPILPAPYALSLRPGAVVSGAVQGGPVLDVVSAGSVGFRASTLSADASDAAVVGVNYGSGPGGMFTSSHGMNGTGVQGFGGDVGVYGYGEWGAGVSGESAWGLGVLGTSEEDYGVGGYSTKSYGVYGYSDGTGGGVGGEAITGTGVSGQSTYGVGGEFESEYGHALVADGPSLVGGPNPQQVALLKWYPAIQTPISFSVGNAPLDIAFDGANMWVVNGADDTVSVLRASDGAHVMTPTVGDVPVAIAFDGANMWVVNNSEGTVSVLRASDGAHVMTPTVGNYPGDIAFDGANMWVTNGADGIVSVLRASDGAHVMTPTVDGAACIAFDGTNMWVMNGSDGTVSVLRAGDGAHVMTPTVGSDSIGIAFDGANMWVANPLSDTVTVLRASDGIRVMTLDVGDYPWGIAFDGANMWVTNNWDGTVSVLRASDGAHVMTVAVGRYPHQMAFDGANMWVTNFGSDTVSKR